MKVYEKSGVSIKKGDALVSRIKSYAKGTFTKGVLSQIGHFGAFFDADFQNFKKPVLVSSVDGVGTKLKVAQLCNKYDTIGQDLVNHCVNDILCAGAIPLFFLDYLAFGRLKLNIAEQIIKGFALACKENRCALIGGETAEMPGVYSRYDFDIAGTIVGVVEKSKIIDGNKIKKGDILLALPSNGLHTNGYSLARKILLEKFKVDDFITELNSTLGEELLKIHKSYLNAVLPLLKDNLVNGISHITGGGIVGNTKRILPKSLNLNIDWHSWERPFIFELIKKLGKVTETEMREVFNLGIGMILIVNQRNIERVIRKLSTARQQSLVIGEIK